jgi:hypothetical protein
MDVDAKSQRSKDPHKLLDVQEREKKRKKSSNVGTPLPWWHPARTIYFSKESRTLLKKLSALLAEKWEKPYSEIYGYANAQMSIAMVRATHLC